MSEFLRRTKVVTLAVAMGLGASACGGGDSAEAQSSVRHESKPHSSGLTHDTQYYPDGTRILRFGGQRDVDGYATYIPTDVYEFCDGRDLVEVPIVYHLDNTGLASRSPNHPACDDGKLTPADFRLSPQ